MKVFSTYHRGYGISERYRTAFRPWLADLLVHGVRCSYSASSLLAFLICEKEIKIIRVLLCGLKITWEVPSSGA